MKNNEQFEEWLNVLRKHPTDRKFSDCNLILHSQGYDFEDMPFSMQWGVYLEFFDSVGIYIELCKAPTMDYYYFMINDSDEDEFKDYKQATRQEAQKEAIKKAFELLD